MIKCKNPIEGFYESHKILVEIVEARYKWKSEYQFVCFSFLESVQCFKFLHSSDKSSALLLMHCLSKIFRC